MAAPAAAEPAAPPRSRGRGLLRVLVVLLGAAWFVAVPVLTLQALVATMTFLGESPTAADHLEQHHRFGTALLVGGAIVVVGFVASLVCRSTGGATLFAVLLLPTLVVGLTWIGTAPPGPAEPHPARSVACQEHSGGDTRCPGG